jgi:hypothetical protein
MSDTPSPERDVRDRLAEALYCGDYRSGGWEFAPAMVILGYRAKAERVLAAAPSVDLTIARRVG